MLTEALAEKTEEKKLTRSDLKRLAIVSAAADAFAENGYEATSMDDIASRANVSKRTVYNHFENKGALFGAIITMQCGASLQKVKARISENASIRDTLIEFGVTFLSMIYEERSVKFFRSVVAEACRFPELGEVFFQTGVCPAENPLQDAIRTAVARGEIDTDDPEFAATMLFAMLKGNTHFSLLLGVRSEVPQDEIEAIVIKVVDVWLKAFQQV